jgi:hypothetical protein
MVLRFILHMNGLTHGIAMFYQGFYRIMPAQRNPAIFVITGIEATGINIMEDILEINNLWRKIRIN